MLTVITGGARDCAGHSRRDFLRAGALGLGGLSLPWLFQMQARGAAQGPGYVRDKAVVLVFLSGGASHIETFNPNLSAPAPFGSVTGEVKTDLPGVTIGGTFPQLARQIGRAALVRSFQHGNGNHEQAIRHVLTGGLDPTGQGKDGHSLGSVYARFRGANHAETGLPTFALLTGPEVDPQYRNERSRVQEGSDPGSLGPGCAPFQPEGQGPALDNMQLRLPPGRLDDRTQLLSQLDSWKRRADAPGALDAYDAYTRQAVDLLLGGAARAFDLTDEDERTRERYDTRMFRVGKKVFRPADIGQQLLTARRLIEHGCGFVTVHTAGWDMHADGNNPGIAAGMEMLGRPLDKALSAFLEDLADRGLDQRVLTIVTGDFGRTPTINKNGGRDHWSNLCTLALFDGGLRMGQVIGQAGPKNDVPRTEPVRVGNLLATVMHALFDVGKLRLAAGAPRQLVQAIEREPPLAELV